MLAIVKLAMHVVCTLPMLSPRRKELSAIQVSRYIIRNVRSIKGPLRCLDGKIMPLQAQRRYSVSRAHLRIQLLFIRLIDDGTASLKSFGMVFKNINSGANVNDLVRLETLTRT